MIKSIKTALGVTLLEILLVLVIASLIIVMSVRYYQTASSSSKVNSAMEILTGYMSAAEAYIAGGGALSSVTCTSAGSCTALGAYLPGSQLSNSPWGTGTVTFTGGSSTYSVAFGSVPTGDCARMVGLLTSNPNVTTSSCTGSASGTTPVALTFTVTP